MDEATARALGGKAAQAKLTPEERARRGRKSARTLGREGRSARSAKGWATRRAHGKGPELTLKEQQDIDRILRGGDILSTAVMASIREPKPATCAMGKECTHPDCEGQAIVVKVEPKTKRPLPKPGTDRALALDAVTKTPSWPRAIFARSAFNPAEYDLFRNALSSLRTAGHVVSEGPGRAKLWRLA